MSEEKQIALELTKLYVENSTCEGIVGIEKENVIDTYLEYIDKLKGKKVENQELDKIMDENSTYKFIFESINNLLKQDNNNFVLKEDIKRILGGIYEI